MQKIHERCCGLDVHKRSVTACLITPAAKGEFARTTRTFGTTTAELLELVDWLVQSECTIVAMESTGSYWKPVYNLLDGALEVWVVNAHHIKSVPGRKTDVKAAQWIAQLLQHGLLRPSFIPDTATRELRELVRYRKSLVQARSAEVNRIQKVLEGANIKLASVATDIMGMSGREILSAIVAGRTNPEEMAALAKGKLRSKLPQLQQALSGTVPSTSTLRLGSNAVACGLPGRNTEAVLGRNCRALASVTSRPRTLVHHSGCQTKDRRTDFGRDWDRHDSVPNGKTSSFVGRSLPRSL